MGIRERGYRAWEGRYTSHGMRWWTVARQGLRATINSKVRLFGMLAFTVLVWIPFFFFGLFWFIGEVSETGQLFGRDYDVRLRQDLFHLFQGWQVAITPIFVAAMATPMVSTDLRTNALYIYLSKPMRRMDYILGKMTAATVLAIPVTVLPGMFVFIMAIGSTDKATSLDEPWKILGELMLTQLLLLVVLVSISLAGSSLTKRWWIALSGIVGGHFILWIVSNILQFATARRTSGPNREWMVGSLATNLDNIARRIYDISFISPQNPTSLPLATSLVVVLGITAIALGIFFWKLLRLEVAE